MVKELTKDNFGEVLKSETLYVVDFYADWCGPCKMLSPIMEELSGEMTDVRFGKVNVDSEGEIAADFHVESIPMVALVKNNTFIDFSVGYKPKDAMRTFIEENK